jgi:hypothetical protein
MNEPTRRYRPPRESNYARLGWWAGHGAELVGAVAGLVAGFILGVLLEALFPAGNFGWVPLVGLVVGAIGLRYVVRRRLER